VTLVVRDAAGRPVEGLRGEVRAERADDAALDAEAPVVAQGDGRYVAHLPLRRDGLYRVGTRLEGGAAPWLDERHVQVGP
jgi:hypothetical protein